MHTGTSARCSTTRSKPAAAAAVRKYDGAAAAAATAAAAAATAAAAAAAQPHPSPYRLPSAAHRQQAAPRLRASTRLLSLAATATGGHSRLPASSPAHRLQQGSHVTHKRHMSHTSVTCHTQASHVTHKRDMSHTSVTCHIQASHVTYKRHMSHTARFKGPMCVGAVCVTRLHRAALQLSSTLA